MRTILLTLAGLLCLAQPALAERKVCHITRTEGSISSDTGAVLEPKFDRLLIQTGPYLFDIGKEPDSPVQFIDGSVKAAVLFMFWLGEEVPGKSWREPGGIAFRLGGFAVTWPNFKNEDGRVTRLRTVLKSGEAASDRSRTYDSAAYTMRTGEVMVIDEDMTSEWPYNWDHRTAFKDEYEPWLNAIRSGAPITMTFGLDRNNEKPFAATVMTWPDLNELNARATRDIQDFRLKVDPQNCVPGPRNTLP